MSGHEMSASSPNAYASDVVPLRNLTGLAWYNHLLYSLLERGLRGFNWEGGG